MTYKYTTRLTFDPNELPTGDPLREVFRNPRMTVIWCIRKSRHITYQGFIDSCRALHRELLQNVPSSFIEFYDIASKYGYGEIKLEDSYIFNPWSEGRKRKAFISENFEKYWLPFYQCWRQPSLLEIRILIKQNKDLFYGHALGKATISQELEYLNNVLQDEKSDDSWSRSCAAARLQKIDDIHKKHNINLCRTNNILVNTDNCPACGGKACLSALPLGEALAKIGIESDLTESEFDRIAILD
jgi:hypothetical protein